MKVSITVTLDDGSSYTAAREQPQVDARRGPDVDTARKAVTAAVAETRRWLSGRARRP